MAMTLRTDDVLQAALRRLSELEGVSQQEVVRRAVLDRAERAAHRAAVDESAQRLNARWGAVLDRLGTV